MILEQVGSDSWRRAERRWTEKLIRAGHRLTNGERRSRDAREREAKLMREAISNGRKVALSLGRCG